ncbi:hypothetical protein V8E36_005024 [Tilletia maclaganii]
MASSRSISGFSPSPSPPPDAPFSFSQLLSFPASQNIQPPPLSQTGPPPASQAARQLIRSRFHSVISGDELPPAPDPSFEREPSPAAAPVVSEAAASHRPTTALPASSSSDGAPSTQPCSPRDTTQSSGGTNPAAATATRSGPFTASITPKASTSTPDPEHGTALAVSSLMHLSQSFSHASTSTMSSDPRSQPSVPLRDWTAKPELHNTKAHSYRGPLSGTDVLALLSLPDLSEHATGALTGSSGGYLQYFHFIGLGATPPARQRPGSQATAASPTPTTAPISATADPGPALAVAAPSLRERWQCRACHFIMHVPPGQVSNLGAHLFGSIKAARNGCLELRADNPAEYIPPVKRSHDGAVVRIRTNKPTSARRAPRSARKATTSPVPPPSSPARISGQT